MDWQQLLLFALLGLGAGSLIAGIALGIVLQYRGSGIINIATGAIAMVGGYSFWSLKTGIYGWDAPTWAALVITLVVLLVLGVVIEYLAFRPLRTGSPLAKLAASLGVLLVAQASVSLAFGIGTKPQPPVLPRGVVTIFGAIGPGRPADPAGDRPPRDARPLAALQAEPLRARDARGVGERGRRDAPRPLAEPARARQHAARDRRRRRPRDPRRLDRAARLDVAAAAGRARAHGRALRRLHVVLDRGARRARRSGCSRTSSTTSRRSAGSRPTTASRCPACSRCSCSA